MKISKKVKGYIDNAIAIIIAIPILSCIIFTPTIVLQNILKPIVGLLVLAAVVLYVLGSYSHWKKKNKHENSH